MARMYPPTLDGYQSDSIDQEHYIPHGERKVYELLREGLNENEWEVFWDVRFFRDVHALYQRQIDFVICHPHWGILTIEVKGGRYEYVPEKGGWCAVRHDNYRLDRYRSAWDQLNTAYHEFFNPLRLGYGISFMRGMGVVLPHCKLVPLDGKLPPQARGEITADMQNCTCPAVLRAWVMLRFRELRKAFPGAGDMVPNPVDRFVARELRPRVSSVVPLAAIIRQAQDDEAVFTAEQRAILNQLRDPACRRALVSGFAGTGKTFVAAHYAAEVSNQNKSVAVLCFNANVSRQIGWTIQDVAPAVQVAHFHAFCDDQAERAGLSRPAPAADPGTDAAARVDMLERAFVEGELLPYDAIVIDEGQDFRPEWIETVRETVLKPDGILAVFFDPLQDIYSVGDVLRKTFTIQPLRLVVNCRNVRSLVTAMRPIFADLAAMESPDQMPDGLEVQPCRVVHGEDEYSTIEKLIIELTDPDGHGLRASQIVLLSPQRIERTSLAGKVSIAGFAIRDYAMRSATARDRVVYFETIHSFKGCECDVVILHGIPGRSLTNELRYIAVSRARFALYIVCSEDWPWPWP